jgi:hypothetical protein
MKIFSKFKKQYLNYLEKLVEQHFSKTLFDASESANVLLYRKRTKKVHLNVFASVDQNPQ